MSWWNSDQSWGNSSWHSSWNDEGWKDDGWKRSQDSISQDDGPKWKWQRVKEEEDYGVKVVETPSTPPRASTQMAPGSSAHPASASDSANSSQAAQAAQLQAMAEKVAKEKEELEQKERAFAIKQQKAELDRLEKQRVELEQKNAELEKKQMASTMNHAKLPEPADSTAVHSDDLSGQFPAGWEVRGFFNEGLNGVYERSDKDFHQVRGTCPINGYSPTPTYWNRESPKETPVFFHWQYTKRRYVCLPQFGVGRHDFFADVVQGRYGEDSLAMAFFSNDTQKWYEHDERFGRPTHTERAIKYTQFSSKSEIPREDMLPAGTGAAVVAPRRMLCARTPVPGQSPGTPLSMLHGQSPGTPRGTLPGTPKGAPGTPKGAAPGTPTGAVPGTPRQLPGTHRADGLQDAKVQKKEEDDDNEIAQILDHAVGKSPIEKKDELFDDIHNTTNTWKEQAKAKKQKDDAKKEEVKEEEKEEKTREMKLSPVP